MNNLNFSRIKKENIYLVFNSKNEHLGQITKRRVGRFMHWCFEPEAGTFFTNGCMKEITSFVTKLYAKEVKGESK